MAQVDPQLDWKRIPASGCFNKDRSKPLFVDENISKGQAAQRTETWSQTKILDFRLLMYCIFYTWLTINLYRRTLHSSVRHQPTPSQQHVLYAVRSHHLHGLHHVSYHPRPQQEWTRGCAAHRGQCQELKDQAASRVCSQWIKFTLVLSTRTSKHDNGLSKWKSITRLFVCLFEQNFTWNVWGKDFCTSSITKTGRPMSKCSIPSICISA